MYPRGRAPVIVNPDEFRPNAMQSWAAIVKDQQPATTTRTTPKRTDHVPTQNVVTSQLQQSPNAQTQITEQLQSQISTITANTQAEFRTELAKMNEKIEAITQRTAESEQRINDIDESLQHMSAALKSLTLNIEKHSAIFDRMHDSMETITHDLHQKTSELGDGIASIIKTLGTLTKKRMYTDVNGIYRPFDPNRVDDSSMDDNDDDNQPRTQTSVTSTTALPRARVSSQSSAQIGNNTDQSQAGDQL